MTTALPTEDADLVVLARRGGVDAFAILYERYFAEIFDFLTRLLRDRDEAADVAQDTFVKAFERLGHLKNPASFKSWLFTIAHRNALNRIKRSKRAVAVGGFTDVEVEERISLAIITVDLTDDPVHQVEVREAAEIVWEAAAGLDERTYTVMDLHVRHGLDSAEIAEVLGVSKGNAYTMVSRMKKSVSDTMATYLLVRKGRRDCEGLAAIVNAHGGPELTPELRRSVDKHARECGVCHENRRTLFVPLKLFAALAAVPVPIGLQESIWGSAAATAAAGAAASAAATIGTNGASGAGGATAAGAGATGAAAGTATTAATAGTATTAAAAAVATTAVVGAGAQSIAGIAAGVLLLVAAAAGGIAVITSDDVPAGPAAIDRVADPSSDTTVLAGGTGPVVGDDGETTDTTVGSGDPAVDPPATDEPRSPLPPLVTRDDVVVVAEDTTAVIDVLANDGGAGVPGISMAIGDAPRSGTATAGESAITYRPAPDFNGQDTLTYTVTRPEGDTASATVRISVTPVNDAPRLVDAPSFSVAEDSVLRIDPLAGIVDPEGDPIEITGFDRFTAQGGVVASGVTAYVPADDFFGSDSFTYQVSDGEATLTVPVSVTVEGRNDAPRHGALEVSGREDVDISFDALSGWYDIEGDPVSMATSGELITEQGGTATISAAGSVIYRPPSNHNGADSFVYDVTDGVAIASGTMAIDLAPVNDAPTASDLRVSVDEGLGSGSTVGSLSASDIDGDELTFVVTDGDTDWLAVDDDGVVTASRTLNHEESAALELRGNVVDPSGAHAGFVVAVAVGDVPEPPLLDDHAFSIEAGAAPNTVVGTVVARDEDEGDSVSYAILDDPNEVLKIDAASGQVTLARRGLGRFFPLTVRIRAADTTGNSTIAQLTVTARDVEGPRLSRPLVDNYVVYEALGPGQACPLGPNRARIGVRVSDPSGIDSVVLDWSAVFNGSRVTGVTAMAFDDPYATGSFTFEAGLVPEGERTTLEATIVATDGAGNRSRSGTIVITVRSCDVGG